MRLGRILAMLFVVIAGTNASLAQDASEQYLQKIGGWTIASAPEQQCLAFNRPGENLEVAPFNALWIVLGPGDDDVAFKVYFWPGAFKKGAQTRMAFSNDRGLTLTYTSIAIEDFAVLTKDAVDYKDMQRFGDAPLLHVYSPAINRKLVFDSTDLSLVLRHLEQCMSVMRR